MTKKALVSALEPAGNIPEGRRVLEVVDTGQEFEIYSGLGTWIDCPDTVEGLDKNWYNPITQQFKKTPVGAFPGDGIPGENEENVFDWDTETWSIQPKS